MADAYVDLLKKSTKAVEGAEDDLDDEVISHDRRLKNLSDKVL